MKLALPIVLLAGLTATPAYAQTASTGSGQAYPVKPVRMINPFSPGGSLDLVARSLAKHMSAELGQQVVVENRPGAGGSIGIELVAKSPPDGYTLLAVQTSLAINPSLQQKTPYDPVRDFAPICSCRKFTIAAGVPAGASTPCHGAVLKSFTPASASVGTSGR